MPAVALAEAPTGTELACQLKILYEEIGDRVNRIRHRLHRGEPPDAVIADTALLLMAASITNPKVNPLRAVATEAAAALVFAAQLSALEESSR